MWKQRTSLFESCLNSNSWFYLLPHSQLQYLNPIKGYKEISLSQTQAKKWRHSPSLKSKRITSSVPLSHFQSTQGLSMRFLIPTVAFPVLVSSEETSIWKSVTARTKQLSLFSWRKIKCLHSDGLQAWAPYQTWPRNSTFGKISLSGFGLH